MNSNQRNLSNVRLSRNRASGLSKHNSNRRCRWGSLCTKKFCKYLHPYAQDFNFSFEVKEFGGSFVNGIGTRQDILFLVEEKLRFYEIFGNRLYNLFVYRNYSDKLSQKMTGMILEVKTCEFLQKVTDSELLILAVECIAVLKNDFGMKLLPLIKHELGLRSGLEESITAEKITGMLLELSVEDILNILIRSEAPSDLLPNEIKTCVSKCLSVLQEGQ